MRQSIGKELISHGIDNANYGINSTAGSGEGSHPYVTAQLAAHTSRGNYANGVQVHGGSGGIVTLDSTLGNEFSHEVGHNFGLGHYVDGFRAPFIVALTRSTRHGAGTAIKSALYLTFIRTRRIRKVVLTDSVRSHSKAASLVLTPWREAVPSPTRTVSLCIPRIHRQ